MSKTLINILYVFLSVVFAKFVGMFTFLVLPKMLQPDNYGIWVTLILISAFAPIACLGTMETLVKQVPYYLGRNEHAKVKEIEDTVLSSIVISAVLLVVVGLNFDVFYRSEQLNSMRQLIYIMVVAAALSFFSGFFFYRFTAHQNFKTSSAIDVTRSLSSCLFLLVCTWYWGLLGTVMGYFFSELIICMLSVILSFRICGSVGLNFNFKVMLELIKVGLPISLVWWIYILQVSVDRVITMSMLGKTLTGYYGLGTSIISIFILIPNAVGQVLYPKINEKIGTSFDNNDISLLVISPTRALSLILTFVIGIVIVISPVIFYKIFPNYGPGLLATQLLSLGTFFLCLNRNGVNYLIAINKQKILLFSVIICLVVNVVGNVLLIKAGYSIEGVAVSTSFASFLMTTLTWRYVLKYAGYTFYEQMRELFILYLPFIFLIVILAVLKMMAPIKLGIPDNLTIISHTIIFSVVFISLITSVPPMSKVTREIYRLLDSRW